MSSFTVRVELHEADEEHYETLHQAMDSEGFVRWVRGGDQQFRLPTAEYNLLNSTLDKSAVLAKAVSAAKKAKPTPTPWVLVTESAGRTWSGLEAWDD